MRIRTRLQRLEQRARAGRVKPSEERPATGFSATRTARCSNRACLGTVGGIAYWAGRNPAHDVGRTPVPPGYLFTGEGGASVPRGNETRVLAGAGLRRRMPQTRLWTDGRATTGLRGHPRREGRHRLYRNEGLSVGRGRQSLYKLSPKKRTRQDYVGSTRCGGCPALYWGLRS